MPSERVAVSSLVPPWEKEQELITALGGDPSPQERLIIADAVKNMLYVATLDEYLMQLDGSMVRNGKVISVIDTRTHWQDISAET